MQGLLEGADGTSVQDQHYRISGGDLRSITALRNVLLLFGRPTETPVVAVVAQTVALLSVTAAILVTGACSSMPTMHTRGTSFVAAVGGLLLHIVNMYCVCVR
jgi:hypothetical protein